MRICVARLRLRPAGGRQGRGKGHGDLLVRPLDLEQDVRRRVHGHGQRLARRAQVAIGALCAPVAHAVDELAATAARRVVPQGGGSAYYAVGGPPDDGEVVARVVRGGEHEARRASVVVCKPHDQDVGWQG